MQYVPGQTPAPGWNTFGPVFQPATPSPALHVALQPKGHVPQRLDCESHEQCYIVTLCIYIYICIMYIYITIYHEYLDCLSICAVLSTKRSCSGLQSPKPNQATGSLPPTSILHSRVHISSQSDRSTASTESKDCGRSFACSARHILGALRCSALEAASR